MGRLTRAAVFAALHLRLSRRVLNRRYLTLDPAGRERFHGAYAKLFRRHHPPVQDGRWSVHFLGTEIAVPLRSSLMWLDWDCAASIVGHDLEVKLAYERALSSPGRPDVFLDIGSNYGSHAILMASQGLEVIAFEPLAECVVYGQEWAEANGLSFRCHNVALSDEPGMLELAYPPRDTWLATAGPSAVQAARWIRASVTTRRLDDFAEALAGKRLLIKIDVEGHEANVLRGADRVLSLDPTIIFESRAGDDRGALWDTLGARRFSIHALSLSGEQRLDRGEFIEAPETNFIARPAEAATAATPE